MQRTTQSGGNAGSLVFMEPFGTRASLADMSAFLASSFGVPVVAQLLGVLGADGAGQL
jgi:hypothetical protein